MATILMPTPAMWYCGYRCGTVVTDVHFGWGCGTPGGHRCSTVVFVPFISCISSQTYWFEKYFGSYSVNFNSEEITRINITKDTIPHVINSRPSLNVIIQSVSQWCFVFLNRCFLRYQILEANRACLYIYVMIVNLSFKIVIPSNDILSIGS